ncbi:MAG TPA: hypothetical protein ENG09_02655 [Candidatus Syntrophoarchaeum butanivorans]|uniref:Molybdenum cofactor biosynthesis protein MoaE n=1 Tax=Candidatus Syntropharchaeum butanivorans TaxID=1839936 RepID=A0A7C1B695_9EURY|nr:MAG: hypothetical protein CW694_06555 [Candidatus Syntrophoarchaeum sp. WYZ-LMO15]HDM36143.1 hypothetical protein [Candidatus Syntrophoarchaeum butanivorans]
MSELERLIGSMKGDRRVGGIATFTGIVRGDPGVLAVEFELSDEMLDERLKKIADGLKGRDGIVDVLIHHNAGRLEVGDEITRIVVAGSHREQVLSALRDAIDLIKQEVHESMKEIRVE